MDFTKKQWADGPLPLVATPEATRKEKNKATWLATQMAIVHNDFMRQINSVYHQAPFVTKKEDIADLLKYASFTYGIIEHHHHVEETQFFPLVEEITGQPGLMDANFEGHKSFMDGFHAWGNYVKTTTPDAFDVAEFKRLIDAFSKEFATHMSDEIGTLVSLEKYDDEAIARGYVELEEKMLADVDKAVDFPIMLGGHDATWEGGIHHWPPVPFFVLYIVEYWYARKHRGVWRFSPCTFQGKPRPLEFIPDSR